MNLNMFDLKFVKHIVFPLKNTFSPNSKSRGGFKQLQKNTKNTYILQDQENGQAVMKI